MSSHAAQELAIFDSCPAPRDNRFDRVTTKLHGKVQRQLLVKQHVHRPARLHRIRRAWTETRPFGWLGRYYQYRTSSIWPRPVKQPHPPL